MNTGCGVVIAIVIVASICVIVAAFFLISIATAGSKEDAIRDLRAEQLAALHRLPKDKDGKIYLKDAEEVIKFSRTFDGWEI